MSVIDFNKMPDSSRIWVFAAERPLEDREENLLNKKMSVFLQEWTAHKRELTAAWQLRYRQFIMVAVDEDRRAASGCSIDSMTRNLGNLEGELDCQLVGTSTLVFYRDSENSVACVERAGFKRLLAEGRVDDRTIVFNNIIATLGEVRQGKWEVPLKASWHAKAFAITAE